MKRVLPGLTLVAVTLCLAGAPSPGCSYDFTVLDPDGGCEPESEPLVLLEPPSQSVVDL